MPVRAQRSLSRGILAAALYGALSALPAIASAQLTSYQFDIASQSLSRALRTFAQVSGQDIVFTEDLVVGLKVQSLKGSFTVEVAVGRLLEGTGLAARRSTSGVLMIVRDVAAKGPYPTI